MIDPASHVKMSMMGLRINILFITILSCVALDNAATSPDVCNIPECDHKPPQKHANVQMFSVNGKPLNFIGKMYQISPPSNESYECFINTTEFISDMFSENTIAIGNVAVNCLKPMLVHFTSLPGHISFSNVWLYFQTILCQITVQSISRISRFFDLKILTLIQTDVIKETESCFDSGPEDVCYGLLQAGSIMLTHNSLYENKQPNITDLFACNESFPLMNEVTFYNMSFTETPQELSVKFPNIQSLRISHFPNLTAMNFTWNPNDKILEKNLTMMDYFMSMYADAYHIVLPRTRYRRGVALEHSNISSLKNVHFHGPIDMIQLRHNKIVQIYNETFKETEEVQHIDLSNNNINILEEESFDGLDDLRYISLKKNNISKLPARFLTNLNNLVFVDLSYNNISILTYNFLAKKPNLSEVHLDNNLIENIPFLYVEDLLQLSKVNLENNPLKSIPTFLFHIPHLEKANLRNTSVTFNNLTDITININLSLMVGSEVKQLESTNDFANINPKTVRVIDLAGSNISTINLGVNHLEPNSHSDKILTLLFKYYFFNLKNNNIVCDCTLIHFHEWVMSKKSLNIFQGNEKFFSEWVCQEPREFKGQNVMSILPEETYCKTQIQGCPDGCVCYKRSFNEIIIVDCEGLGMTSLPRIMPLGGLDLWFSNNNLTAITVLPYFSRIRQLKLNNNKIDTINHNVLPHLKRIEILYLDSNLMSHIPENIQDVALSSGSKMSLGNNPLKCDCHSLWMKSWILSSHEYILNWTSIICNNENGAGQPVVSVKDEDFICVEDYDVIKHVIIPAIICSFILFLMTIAVIFLYFKRLQVKVLIYKYTQWHPFDKDENEIQGKVDVLIIHAPSMWTWIKENVITILETGDYNFKVCCLSRDFVVGFSYQENIRCFSKMSKRILLVLSDDLLDTSELFKLSWSETVEKLKFYQSNYLIAVGHNVHSKCIQNKEFIRYIKNGKFFKTSDYLFKEKLMYFMHVKPVTQLQSKDISMTNNTEWISYFYENKIKSNDYEFHDIFLSYDKNDQEYVIKDLWKKFVLYNFSVLLPERDFEPGNSTEDNISSAISSCRHTVLVFSKHHINNEWSLFTFRSAVEKSLRNKYNHLVLILHQCTFQNIHTKDEEINHYIKTSVILETSDNFFWEKLRQCLSNSVSNNKQIMSNNLLDEESQETNVHGKAIDGHNDQQLNNHSSHSSNIMKPLPDMSSMQQSDTPNNENEGIQLFKMCNDERSKSSVA